MEQYEMDLPHSVEEPMRENEEQKKEKVALLAENVRKVEVLTMVEFSGESNHFKEPATSLAQMVLKSRGNIKGGLVGLALAGIFGVYLEKPASEALKKIRIQEEIRQEEINKKLSEENRKKYLEQHGSSSEVFSKALSEALMDAFGKPMAKEVGRGAKAFSDFFEKGLTAENVTKGMSRELKRTGEGESDFRDRR